MKEFIKSNSKKTVVVEGKKRTISIENIEGDIKADEIFVYYKNEEELQKMYSGH